MTGNEIPRGYTMLTFLIGAGIAGAAGVVGHIKSRHFVGQRLRYTKIVEKPALGLWAGVGTVVLTAPLTFLPLIGAGTVLAVSAGVGTGVALGVADSKEPPKLLEDDF
jgi:hypothetical protein